MSEAREQLIRDLKALACSHSMPPKAQLLILEAIGALSAPPEVGDMEAKLIQIADSNSDLYESERMWLREAAAVLRGMREPQGGE